MRKIFLILPFTIASCQSPSPETTTTKDVVPVVEETGPSAVELAKSEYDVTRFIPQGTADSLLANMITFIYKRPTIAINRDRTLPQFRAYYVAQLPLFTHTYHTVTADSTHWYYLIRPARSVEGDLRGMGGRFRTNAKLEMVEFEEVFNTPVMARHDLERVGLMLFEDMVSTGNVDRYLNDRTLVEWPDDRLKYNKEKREWRYDE